jgi:hypothetical protein
MIRVITIQGTKQVGSIGKASVTSISGNLWIRISTGTSAILVEVFLDIPYYLPADARVVPRLRSRPIPSISFSIHYSLYHPNHSSILIEALRYKPEV